MKRYSNILSAIFGTVWAIQPEKLHAIMGFLDARIRGLALDADTVEKLAASNRNGSQPVVNRSVAVMPIYGTIANRVGLLDEASGGISSKEIGRAFDALVADESVGAIVMDIDSPGGDYAGTPELADKIFAARGTKPIVAVADSLAASALYWIGSAADEFVVTPSGDVGSVGVVAVHTDWSEFNADEGIKPTYITYGENKAEFNPDAPLGDSAREELQRQVNLAGETFVKAVARNRGTTAAKVKSDFGQGRTYPAREAVERGMADRVATLEDTIARMAGMKKASGKRARIERERLALDIFR